jgi:putative addiction module component (TIGR02574 family)
MPTELEKCEQQAKHLSLQERALLIKRLIEGLDDLDEHDLEQLWIKEASRRFQEFKAGNIKARPGADVFYDARTRLQGMR